MASLKYRCLTPNVEVEEHPVAASQKFFHEGGAFCYLDGSGHVTNCIVDTASIYGWVLVPQGRGAGTSDAYWQSSATAGKDKVMVVVDEDAKFLVTVDAAITIANVGDALDFATPPSNDGTVQTFALTTPGEDVARIVGLGTSLKGGTTTNAIVKINVFQADT